VERQIAMGVTMRGYRQTAAGLLVTLGLTALAGCANPIAPTATQAQAPPPLAPGMARLWVLRQANPPGGNIEAARPMVFANGAPIGESKEGTAFFHDFRGAIG
jgi:hypothetical protein